MKKLLTVILFCALTLGMASMTGAAEAKWQRILENFMAADYKIFYETNSFKTTSNTTYSVLIKYSFPESEAIQMNKLVGWPLNATYNLRTIHLDYKNKVFLQESSFDFYNKNDKFIKTVTIEDADWDIFGDFEAEIFKETFPYYDKHYR